MLRMGRLIGGGLVCLVRFRLRLMLRGWVRMRLLRGCLLVLDVVFGCSLMRCRLLFRGRWCRLLVWLLRGRLMLSLVFGMFLRILCLFRIRLRWRRLRIRHRGVVWCLGS